MSVRKSAVYFLIFHIKNSVYRAPLQNACGNTILFRCREPLSNYFCLVIIVYGSRIILIIHIIPPIQREFIKILSTMIKPMVAGKELSQAVVLYRYVLWQISLIFSRRDKILIVQVNKLDFNRILLPKMCKIS